MTIYDITRELFSTPAYPGDSTPRAVRIRSMARGDSHTLSDIHMSAHNGTHLDAPLHFIAYGASAADIPLSRCVGQADVVTLHGYFDDTCTEDIPVGCRRLLLRADTVLTASGAEAIVRAGIVLVGVEAPTVGDVHNFVAVHKILLGGNVAVIENLDLSRVPDGRYFLSAAPMKGEGLDGAPVRAYLIGE